MVSAEHSMTDVTYLQLTDLDGGLARHHGVDAGRECPVSLAAEDACVKRTGWSLALPWR